MTKEKIEKVRQECQEELALILGYLKEHPHPWTLERIKIVCDWVLRNNNLYPKIGDTDENS